MVWWTDGNGNDDGGLDGGSTFQGVNYAVKKK
ncbi:hypothetical protein L195_g028241, partial [Trifolium pratense]